MSLPLLLVAAVQFAQDPVVPPKPRLPLPAPPSGAVAAVANDNRTPAGTRRGDTLVVEIDVLDSRWRPEGPTDPEVPALAFAERGKAPSVPGPIIRARVGTPVKVVLRSQVDSALVLGGLRPEAGIPVDTVQLAARGTREVRYTLAKPGAFIYWAAFAGTSASDRMWLDSQLNGAIVVDPPGGAPPDRVFLISEWFLPHPDRPFESALVFNGKAWPHTERLTLTQGDSVRFRVLNAAAIEHPMHLHGFYYRVTERGMWNRAGPVPPERQMLANTETMPIGGTLSLAFVPTTPGNWVFHCHFAAHVGDEVTLAGSPPRPGAPNATLAANTHDAHGGSASGGMHQMRGLVLGLHVLPRGDARLAATDAPTDIRLLVQANPNRLIGRQTAVGFVVQRGAAPARDSVVLPGPVLELPRGRPARITVVNNLAEATGVHWHGLEIESFPDGVPGWSGTPGRIMPPIAPGDSFVAEFTPPRAGTFLYHSHLHELAQIGNGMYGALLVLDGPRDLARDHLVVVGGGGQSPYAKELSPFVMVNGRYAPRPLRMTAGVPQRIRLVSIHPDWNVSFSLVGDSTVARWRAIAKDGADLPPALATMRPARVRMGTGETADFEFTPGEPGELLMEIRTTEPGWFVPLRVIVAARP